MMVNDYALIKARPSLDHSVRRNATVRTEHNPSLDDRKRTDLDAVVSPELLPHPLINNGSGMNHGKETVE
jgi:hypothetical protein